MGDSLYYFQDRPDYKELICVDDFLNAINDLRVGAHMNDEVNTLDSVRKVWGQGFTMYRSVSNQGDAGAIVALDSSHTSDTRYPRTGPPPPSTGPEGEATDDDDDYAVGYQNGGHALALGARTSASNPDVVLLDDTPPAVAPTAAAAPVVAQPTGPAQARALCIVQARRTEGKGVEYKVRWEGLDKEHDTWLSPAALPDKMIERFRRERPFTMFEGPLDEMAKRFKSTPRWQQGLSWVYATRTYTRRARWLAASGGGSSTQ
jgi:hypothetical protein